MTPQFWLWLDVVLMSLGGAAILVIGKRRTPLEEAHTAIHGIVPFIAASAYFAMAVGQGSYLLPIINQPGATRVFFYARYVDWTFTTPLLLIVTSMGAFHTMPRRIGTIGAMVAADLLMIATALFFGMSVSMSVKWTWFIISCAAFLPIYWVLWKPLLSESMTERDDVAAAYKVEAGMLSALWFTYPIILFFSTDGLGVFTATTSVALIAIVDLLSKPVYGLVSLRNRSRIVDRDGVSTFEQQPVARRRVA